MHAYPPSSLYYVLHNFPEASGGDTTGTVKFRCDVAVHKIDPQFKANDDASKGQEQEHPI